MAIGYYMLKPNDENTLVFKKSLTLNFEENFLVFEFSFKAVVWQGQLNILRTTDFFESLITYY